MENSVARKAFDHIRENCLVEKGDSIIAGVSGGADSMCMLLLLMKLGNSMDLEIRVAHINHGIRGAEADADARFVEEFCKKNNLEFYLYNADIPKIAREKGKSLEEAGREYRYEVFEELALKTGSNRIAVAHNSGDNAETVLFNIFRGSGIGGLKGIVAKRPFRQGSGIMLIRPILCLLRNEIEEYLKESGQEYCTDSTNSDEGYSRNRVRNTIIPTVKEYINPKAEEHIASLSRQAEEIEDYIRSETEKAYDFISFDKAPDGSVSGAKLNYFEICKLHPVIRKSLIRYAFGTVSGRLKDVGEVHIRDIDSLYNLQSGKSISLPYGIKAFKEYENIVLVNSVDLEDEAYEVNLHIYDRKDLSETIPDSEDIKWFDYDRIGCEPVIRNIMDGDYLIIGKEEHRKSLGRFMIDKKIPLSKRSKINLLAAGNHILWVVGYRRDDSCLVGPDTKRVLVAEASVNK